MFINKDFGLRLTEIMEEVNISDYRLAQAIGIHASTIKSYRIGKTKPDNLKLDAISGYLKVNKHWLINGKEPKWLDDCYKLNPGLKVDYKCPGCIDKEKTIKLSEQIIEMKNKEIEDLKKENDHLNKSLGLEKGGAI